MIKKKRIVNVIDPGYKTQMLKYFASQDKMIKEPRPLLKKDLSLHSFIHTYTMHLTSTSEKL